MGVLQNEYLEAFRSLGSALSHYSIEKTFPVFGFGARSSHDNNGVSHDFALNGNESSPGIKGFEVTTTCICLSMSVQSHQNVIVNYDRMAFCYLCINITLIYKYHVNI